MHSTNPLIRAYRRHLRRRVHRYAPRLISYYHRYFTKGQHRPGAVPPVPATYWPSYRHTLAELSDAKAPKAIAA